MSIILLFIMFSEKDFLEFFFKRVKVNETNRYREDFPYISPCGRERNFIRCDDRPIVFTHIVEGVEGDVLSFGGAEDRLTVPFHPEKVCMLPWTGRIYHPGPDRAGGVGLIKSAMAIAMSKDFEFGPEGEYAPPVAFNWKGQRHELTNELLQLVQEEEQTNADGKDV